MANNKKITPDCNPPHDCFNCPYDDCRRDGSVTSSETEYIKTAGLSKGRHTKNFPLAKDRAHRVRSGWLV